MVLVSTRVLTLSVSVWIGVDSNGGQILYLSYFKSLWSPFQEQSGELLGNQELYKNANEGLCQSELSRLGTYIQQVV